jgi:hypothetical protein
MGLGLVLIFAWLDWHCMVEFYTDFQMAGLTLIFGWLDFHYMVGFGTSFCMVGLALYG